MSSVKIPAKSEKSAKPAKDTIYVDVDDDITAVIDKVGAAKNKVVALVLPKRSAALQSIVNMRLLKRNADDAEKNVVLITSEQALLPLAGAAGIHVAKNLQSRPEVPPAPFEAKHPDAASEDLDAPIDDKEAKLDYHRSIGELAAAKTVEEPETIALGDEEAAAEDEKKPVSSQPKNKKLKIPNFEKFRLMVVLGILGFVGLIVFIILALFVLPKATITIQTESMPVSTSFTMTATDGAKTLDESKNLIPAASKTSDQTSSQQVPATGQQNNGQKASGTVTLTNCSSNGHSISVPAGTGLSANGLTFITQEVATLPHSTPDCQSVNGFTSQDVKVIAQSAGAKYNISNTNFTVAGVSGVTASGSTSGGTDSIVTIVSQQDLDTAKGKNTTQDTNNFTSQFEKQLSDQGFYVLIPTLKPADPVVTSTPSVGQPASTVNVNIKITYSVMVIQKSDLQKAVSDALNKQIDKTRQQLSNNDVLKGLTVSVQAQGSPTNATLSISEQTTAIPIIDQNGLKKQVSGQKAGDIKAAISSLPGVKNVDVKMSPFWVSKAPKSTGKINIILQQVANQGNGS